MRTAVATSCPFLSALLVLAARPPAQDPALLDARRITSGEFAPERFGPVRWLDGRHYATLERGKAALDLVRYDAVAAAREVLVPAERLQVEGRDQPLRIEDYAFAPDGKRLLIFTDSERVWRQNTRGEYWLLDLGKETPPRRVGGALPKSSLMFAKFSPDGARIAYVCRNDLYVEDLATGAQRALTTDGSATTINGTFDWVYEEEFGCRDGFRWSPDGSRIAYWQLDAAGVGVFYLVDDLSDRYSRIVPVQYPKAGTTNSACRIGVVAAAGGPTVWMQTPGDPRQTYLPRMEWHPDGRELMVQWLPRAQNRIDVLAADAGTGAVRTVWTESDKAYVDVRDDFRWLAGGKAFFWTGDTDGYRHARAVPWQPGEATLLTPFPCDLIAVDWVDAAGSVVYASTAEWLDADGKPLARVHGTEKLLTVFAPGKAAYAGELAPRAPAAAPGGNPRQIAPGWHDYQVSPDGALAIHQYSSFDEPPVIDLVRLPAHERVRTLADNQELRRRYAAVRKGRNEFFQVQTADGVECDGWAMYPPDFDRDKRWPVLFHVYGEPWSQTVMDSWFLGHHLFHRWLAQRGWVVMSIDTRGTPAPKGRDWRKALWQQKGVLSSHDWDQAVRALCEQRPWIDRARLAIWGWSGGGSMTLNMLLRYPDLFCAGMAVAPVTDIALYDTIYEERYSGDPRQVPEVYKRCSPITYAADLKAALLLVHGTGDDNVHFQNSERLFDAFVAAGRKFEYLAYPNRTHAIAEGKGTRAHLYDSLADFLFRRVGAGPR